MQRSSVILGGAGGNLCFNDFSFDFLIEAVGQILRLFIDRIGRCARSHFFQFRVHMLINDLVGRLLEFTLSKIYVHVFFNFFACLLMEW